MKQRRFWSVWLLVLALLVSSCAVNRPARPRPPRPPHELPAHPAHPRHPEKPRKPKKPKKPKKKKHAGKDCCDRGPLADDWMR